MNGHTPRHTPWAHRSRTGGAGQALASSAAHAGGLQMGSFWRLAGLPDLRLPFPDLNADPISFPDGPDRLRLWLADPDVAAPAGAAN